MPLKYFEKIGIGFPDNNFVDNLISLEYLNKSISKEQ